MKIQLKILNKEFYSGEETGNFISTKYLPEYATPGSAAMDLVCTKDVTIYPGESVMIPTGLAIWIGSNTSVWGIVDGDTHITGLVLPRSSLGAKGLVLANTIGLIDEDYQGELKVVAWNRKERYIPYERNYSPRIGSYVNDRFVDYEGNRVELKAGDRFAQLMFVPIIKAQWEIVDEFSENTQRGVGGWGSTGK